MSHSIELDFGSLVISATLFDTAVAEKFAARLPCEVYLTQWGGELYGSIGVDLGTADPVPDIPAGGLAYTSNGNYVCIFFGQTPAWAVEYIGQMADGQWPQLLEATDLSRVTIKLKSTGK
jgi:hypothetical protein